MRMRYVLFLSIILLAGACTRKSGPAPLDVDKDFFGFYADLNSVSKAKKDIDLILEEVEKLIDNDLLTKLRNAQVEWDLAATEYNTKFYRFNAKEEAKKKLELEIRKKMSIDRDQEEQEKLRTLEREFAKIEKEIAAAKVEIIALEQKETEKNKAYNLAKAPVNEQLNGDRLLSYVRTNKQKIKEAFQKYKTEYDNKHQSISQKGQVQVYFENEYTKPTSEAMIDGKKIYISNKM